jgi:dTDP-4-amino-4,6-dideoxygalactose transaminase
VDKYTWVDVGSSYVLSDLLAAYLYAQLEQREQIQARRRLLWHAYADRLADWALANGVGLPVVPPHCEQAYHLFYLILPSLDCRQALLAHLRQRGVYAVFHYVPLHLSQMGRRHGGRPGACPVAEDLSDRLVRLPFYYGLSDEEQAAVIQAVRQFRSSAGRIHAAA